MCTIVSKCWLNRFHNLSFMNARIEKLHSSFTNWSKDGHDIDIKWFSHGLGCLHFHSELNHGHLQVQNLSIQRLWSFEQWGLHILWLTIMFFYVTKVQKEREINIKMHPKLWIHNAQGIHQFAIGKYLSNSLTNISIALKYWLFICPMDAIKTFLHID